LRASYIIIDINNFKSMILDCKDLDYLDLVNIMGVVFKDFNAESSTT